MTETNLYRMIQKELSRVYGRYHEHNLAITLGWFILSAGAPLLMLIFTIDMEQTVKETHGWFGFLTVGYMMLMVLVGSSFGHRYQLHKVRSYDQKNWHIIKGMNNLFGLPYDESRCYYDNLVKYKEYLENR